MNSMPVAHNRQEDRRMNRKGIPHRYSPIAPLNMGIQEFKRVVNNSPIGKKAKSQLIKRYKDRAWADLKEIKDAAPTREEIILSGKQ